MKQPIKGSRGGSRRGAGRTSKIQKETRRQAELTSHGGGITAFLGTSKPQEGNKTLRGPDPVLPSTSHREADELIENISSTAVSATANAQELFESEILDEYYVDTDGESSDDRAEVENDWNESDEEVEDHNVPRSEQPETNVVKVQVRAFIQEIMTQTHVAKDIANGQIVFKAKDPRLGQKSQLEDWVRQDMHVFIPTRWTNSLYHVATMPCPSTNCINRWNTAEVGFAYPPSRIVRGWDRDFQLIGYRYKCNSCQTGFNSLNPNSVVHLPLHIRERFQYVIFHRSATTIQVADLFHSYFQAAGSLSGFRDLWNSSRYLRHTKMHIDYLGYYSALFSIIDTYNNEPLIQAGMGAKKVKPIVLPFPLASDPNTFNMTKIYSGFVTNLAMAVCEKLRTWMETYTDNLTATIISADLTFKQRNRHAKINGVSPIVARMNIMNEFGQVRKSVFLPNKTLAEQEKVLMDLAQTLRDNGQLPPTEVYIDNPRAEASIYLKVWEHLAGNVAPSKTGYIKSFALVDYGRTIKIYDNYASACAAASLLKTTLEASAKKYISLDTEHNFYFKERKVIIGTKAATIQIALPDDDCVHLFRPCRWKPSNIPPALKDILLNSEIKKVGRNISFDFGCLEERFASEDLKLHGLDIGAVELARLAKEKGIVDKANVSLQKIVETCLERHLEKPSNVRSSGNWENPILATPFAHYAASDALAGLLAYEYMISLPDKDVPLNLTPEFIKEGQKVEYVYRSGGVRVIAKGVITSLPDRNNVIKVGNIELKNGRCLVMFNECLARNHVLPWGQGKIGDKMANGNSINVILNTSMLRAIVPVIGVIEHRPAIVDYTRTEMLNSNNSSCRQCGVAAESRGLLDEDGQFICEKCFGMVVESDEEDTSLHILQHVHLDVFHAMQRITVPQNHVFHTQFYRQLSNAFFLLNPTDVKAVSEALQENYGVSFRSQLAANPRWIHERVRRYIPGPVLLAKRLTMVLETFSSNDKMDPVMKKPLLDKESTKCFLAVIEDAKAGFISDPPGVDLYYSKSRPDKLGLTLYRSRRGTSALEALHQKQNQLASYWNLGTRMLDYFLLFQNTHHNLKVSERELGWVPIGHYHHHLLDVLQEQEVQLFGVVKTYSWFAGTKDWCRGVGSSGFIPLAFQEKLQDVSFEDMNGLMKQGCTRDVAWLAFKQQSIPPHLPVSNEMERKLFEKLLPKYVKAKGFDSLEMAKAWNNDHAILKDKSATVYKTTAQFLESYFEEYAFLQIKKTALSKDITGLRDLEYRLRTAYLEGNLPWDLAGQEIQKIWQRLLDNSCEPLYPSLINELEIVLPFEEVNDVDKCGECRLVKNSSDWVQCDSASCELWFHLACVGFPTVETVPEKWTCPKCGLRKQPPGGERIPQGIITGPVGVIHQPMNLDVVVKPPWDLPICENCGYYMCPATQNASVKDSTRCYLNLPRSRAPKVCSNCKHVSCRGSSQKYDCPVNIFVEKRRLPTRSGGEKRYREGSGDE